ncbi:dihydrofolate reductase family protein [uncultured Nocardioides sp.]|uniref:dihydrofolate reductase family protein n=1 Tax=uncultured Nocardioides sp. TaxID=198441 RepID=UPI00261AEE4D|nr:dihydrofolate reductase family protein [uncultured Nocardioides sp.]
MAGRLIYSVIGSLDGYLADTEGRFDWAVPDEEVLAHVNDVERGVGTYLYGRRIYELMTAWEDDPAAAAQSEQSAAFADIWTRAEKHVYSTTLREVTTERTTLHRRFDPDEVRGIKEAAPSDLHVSGPTLAQHAFAAGLVDEIQVVVVPVVVGGGLSYHPATPTTLTLLDTRRFGNGMVWLRYDVRGGQR